MHCTSCAGIIERSLKKLEGVSEAHVNFTAEKASIMFDGNLVLKEKLIEVISKAGYKATEVEERGTTKKKAKGKNRKQKNCLTGSL
jgi:Cu+-exporting ATPase